MSESLHASTQFGGFTLGAMQLALPTASIKEVVPRGELIGLPCPADCVVGGVRLHGTTVPVLDLGILLGQSREACEYPSVLVMVHEGRLLGLLADAMTGIFEADANAIQRTVVADPVAAVFHGSVTRGDTHQHVSVLSPRAIADLPQVPMVEQDSIDATHASAEAESDSPRPLMLLRCGSLSFALDALAVETALSNPVLTASVLGRGDCRGTISHDGVRVPALDLQALCGYGAMDESGGYQALVLALPTGRVALLVGEVLDVVRAPPRDFVRVPAFALARPWLFCGALPVTTLAEVPARMPAGCSQFLRLDAARLRASEVIASLAASNVPVAVSGAPLGLAAAATGRASTTLAMITYLLDAENASPVDQITEILPYAVDRQVDGAHGSLLGFAVNRGRSIPVVCLGRLLDPRRANTHRHENVLVVDSGGDLVGFAVSALKSIEPSTWEPSVPSNPFGNASPSSRTRQLALVGADTEARMLPMLDLVAMARSLIGGAEGANSH